MSAENVGPKEGANAVKFGGTDVLAESGRKPKPPGGGKKKA